MSTGAKTFGLHDTLIEPQVLPPPPTRHALFAFLVALAAILQIGTAGWSDIHNGVEGHYAAIALEMSRGEPIAERSEPPLGYWLIVGSFKIFGVSATAARIPIALAVVASVAFTFLIGERLVNYWRGFIAGLIHLCCLGSFVWARTLTAEPLFAAFLGGALFCLTCGFQRPRTRRGWFAGAWMCVALAVLTKGSVGLLYPAAILFLLAALFREARMRFSSLIHWRYLLLFCALILPWIIWPYFQDAGGLGQIAPQWLMPFVDKSGMFGGVPLRRFLFDHLAWWFPALLLVLPGLLFGSRKIFRPHEFDFADALPLCWIAVGFIPLLFFAGRQDHDSISMWSALALWTAAAWDRTSVALRLSGLGLSLVAGVAGTFTSAFDHSYTIPPLTTADGTAMRGTLMLMGFAILISSLAGACFAWRNRENLAIVIPMLGMVPVGLGMAEGVARSGPSLSLANAARYLAPRLGESGEVLYEGPFFAGTSLRFYLERDPLFVSEKPGALLDSKATLEKMTRPHPVFLIIQKRRVPFWQEQLTRRFHLYHQVTTCGPHVILSNEP